MLNIECRSRQSAIVKRQTANVKVLYSGITTIFTFAHCSCICLRRSALSVQLYLLSALDFRLSAYSLQLAPYSLLLTSSHSTTPAATDTFNECFIPNCGISIHPSDKAIVDCSTPVTSLPKITASGSPGSTTS